MLFLHNVSAAPQNVMIVDLTVFSVVHKIIQNFNRNVIGNYLQHCTYIQFVDLIPVFDLYFIILRCVSN